LLHLFVDFLTVARALNVVLGSDQMGHLFMLAISKPFNADDETLVLLG
jgi:hypothetical protein